VPLTIINSITIMKTITATKKTNTGGANSDDSNVRIHLDFLDGLRGLAALYVMLCHMYLSQFGMVARTGGRGVAFNWLLYGHLAVDVFIVLSGFCLAIPVAQVQHIKGGPSEFLRRRARRILPPFYASLLLCVVLLLISHFVEHGHSLPFTIKGLIANALLLQDLFPELDMQFNPPFWSVAVEWKIYFLFPFLLLIWRRYGHFGLLGISAAIGLVVTVGLRLIHPGAHLGHTCPWFLFLFAMGVASGLFTFNVRSREYIPRSIWGVGIFCPVLLFLLVTYPITGKGEAEMFVPHLPLIDITMGALMSSFLMLLTHHVRREDNNLLLLLLTRRPIVMLGIFSYSLYLVHYPLIDYVALLIHKIPVVGDSTGLRAALLFIAGAPSIILFSYVFFLCFERPFLNAKRVRRDSLADTAALEPAL